ncbi:MAG: PAS domain S-box-containing protein [Chlamydiales bacterium]|jgi:PAS domain S-box-containing protein
MAFINSPICRSILSLGTLVAALVLCSTPASAQRYHVRTYGVGDGLPAPAIRGITQDRHGQIWVATLAGPASYDGSAWRTYTLEDGLRSTGLAQIAVDDEGVPWTVSNTMPARLATLSEESWHAFPDGGGTSRRILSTCMAVRGAGEHARALIGTTGGHILVWSCGAREWTTIEAPVPGTKIDAIHIIEGRTLVVSGGRGFELQRDPIDVLVEIQVHVEMLRGLAWDNDDRALFFLGVREVYIQEDGDAARPWGQYDLDLQPGHSGRFRAVPTPDGGLYFGNEVGAFYVSAGQSPRRLDTSSGLVAPGMSALFQDREDNVWVGSERGLSKIVSRRFDTFDREHGLFQSEVTAVLETLDGTMVLGHPDGLTFLEDPPRHLVFSQGTSAGRVLDLDQDSDGTIWVAASWHGLVEIRADGEVLVHGPEEGLALQVTSTLMGDDGPEWIGTSAGIYRRTEVGFERVAALDHGAEVQLPIRNITRGADGRCYAGTGEYGALSWGDDLVPRLAMPEPHSRGISTFTVNPDVNGQIWVATAAGLMVWNDGHLSPSVHPRIAWEVYFIERGENGMTWVGTNNGVYQWDGEHLNHFAVPEGLAGAETNRAAGYLDSHGRFWIGTNRGLSVYDSTRDLPRRHPPTVEILGCNIPRPESSGSAASQTVPFSQNQLTFAYRAIAFTDESRVRFQSFLEGFDSDWSELALSPLRQTTYAHLPPGNYTFKIRVVDVEGQVSEPDVWETIRIREPFWNETWFRALAALLTIGTVYTTSSMVIHRRNSGRLEREVLARTRELSESQAATERQRVRLELTLANIADGVAAISHNGEILVWNRAAHRVTGWSPEEAIGRSLTDLLGAQALAPDRAGRPATEVTLRTGASRHFDIASVETAAVGDMPAGRVVVFRDVTDRLTLDRKLVREEKLAALGLLAGGIAHDFNNLLTVIIGNLSLPLPPTLASGLFAESMQDARSAANRARLLTLQLLTFSKGGEPVRQAVSVADILDDGSSFMFSGANVACEIDVANDLRLVDVDEGQMGQVFHNLMLNAREAMPEGGTVKIRATNLSEAPPFLTEGKYILIEFEDEGVGVSENDLAHIFDPYFSTKSRGSGLGLAIAYSVVQRHGGHVTVNSTIGKGTTFRIYLEASVEQLPDHSAPETIPRHGSGARILIMDDEDAILRVVSSILTASGYRTSCSRTGEEAIAMYEQAIADATPFDAVIMDLTIPGAMGGKQAVLHLRRIDPDVCAIVASGYSNDPIMARANEFGFCAGISKPFGSKELREVLEQALRNKPLPALDVASDPPAQSAT